MYYSTGPVRSPFSRARAYREVTAITGQDIPVLVSKMVEGAREFMAGMVGHPAFGSCLLFWLGGIFAEALADRVFRLTPLNPAEIGVMTGDLHSAALLGPCRGLPPVDGESLAGLCRQSIPWPSCTRRWRRSTSTIEKRG